MIMYVLLMGKSYFWRILKYQNIAKRFRSNLQNRLCLRLFGEYQFFCLLGSCGVLRTERLKVDFKEARRLRNGENTSWRWGK